MTMLVGNAIDLEPLARKQATVIIAQLGIYLELVVMGDKTSSPWPVFLVRLHKSCLSSEGCGISIIQFVIFSSYEVLPTDGNAVSRYQLIVIFMLGNAIAGLTS